MRPVKLKDAVATRNSDPIVIATRYILSKEGKLLDVKDLFDTPEFDRMRKKVSHFNNRFWEAQNKGQHSPLAADPDQVEAAYPLRTTIDGIVAPGSEFRVEKRKERPEYANRTFWPQVPANANIPLYQVVAGGNNVDAAQSVAALHRDPTSDVGGINLDSAMFGMQVQRDGKGMVLPISQQPIGQFMKIKGFKPVLLNIERNIDLPARLGVNLNRLPKEQLAQASSVAG